MPADFKPEDNGLTKLKVRGAAAWCSRRFDHDVEPTSSSYLGE